MADQMLAQIRDRLALLLRDLKVTNGYASDIPNSHIYPHFDKNIVTLTEDAAYPKVFIVLDGGVSDRLPSDSSNEVISYAIIGIFKKIQPTDSPGKMAENFISDVKQLIRDNRTLRNLVYEAWVIGFNTDSGYLDPEGAASLKIVVEYQQRPEP